MHPHLERVLPRSESEADCEEAMSSRAKLSGAVAATVTPAAVAGEAVGSGQTLVVRVDDGAIE